VAANPIGVKDVVGMIGIVEANAFVFNEGIKKMTNNKVDMFRPQ
jgi:hypothetical protein